LEELISIGINIHSNCHNRWFAASFNGASECPTITNRKVCEGELTAQAELLVRV
jgi:hypothetical protein